MVATVTNVGDSNPGSSPDRREGTLVVVDDPASNTTISFDVESDPCPSASWLLNGETEVVTTAGVYKVISPCNDSASRSPYRFSVIVSNLTVGVNIGGYVATFSNLAGSFTSSQIFITPTGESCTIIVYQKVYCIAEYLHCIINNIFISLCLTHDDSYIHSCRDV